MASVLINGQEPILRDLTSGATLTTKVVPSDARNMDINDSLARLKLEKHVAASGTAGTTFYNNALVDGAATLRTALTLGIYDRAVIYLSAASAAGAPSVAFRVFVNYLAGQTFSVASRHETWQQIGDTLTLSVATFEVIEIPCSYQEVGVELIGTGAAGVDRLNVTAMLFGRA